MSYNAKNYTEQGGEITHIGGRLVLDEGAILEGIPTVEFQADSEATTVAGLKDDFNALLTKLKASGYMSSETAEESE